MDNTAKMLRLMIVACSVFLIGADTRRNKGLEAYGFPPNTNSGALIYKSKGLKLSQGVTEKFTKNLIPQLHATYSDANCDSKFRDGESQEKDTRELKNYPNLSSDDSFTARSNRDKSGNNNENYGKEHLPRRFRGNFYNKYDGNRATNLKRNRKPLVDFNAFGVYDDQRVKEELSENVNDEPRYYFDTFRQRLGKESFHSRYNQGEHLLRQNIYYDAPAKGFHDRGEVTFQGNENFAEQPSNAEALNQGGIIGLVVYGDGRREILNVEKDIFEVDPVGLSAVDYFSNHEKESISNGYVSPERKFYPYDFEEQRNDDLSERILQEILKSRKPPKLYNFGYSDNNHIVFNYVNDKILLQPSIGYVSGSDESETRTENQRNISYVNDLKKQTQKTNVIKNIGDIIKPPIPFKSLDRGNPTPVITDDVHKITNLVNYRNLKSIPEIENYENGQNIIIMVKKQDDSEPEVLLNPKLNKKIKNILKTSDKINAPELTLLSTQESTGNLKHHLEENSSDSKKYSLTNESIDQENTVQTLQENSNTQETTTTQGTTRDDENQSIPENLGSLKNIKTHENSGHLKDSIATEDSGSQNDALTPKRFESQKDPNNQESSNNAKDVTTPKFSESQKDLIAKEISESQKVPKAQKTSGNQETTDTQENSVSKKDHMTQGDSSNQKDSTSEVDSVTQSITKQRDSNTQEKVEPTNTTQTTQKGIAVVNIPKLLQMMPPELLHKPITESTEPESTPSEPTKNNITDKKEQTDQMIIDEKKTSNQITDFKLTKEKSTLNVDTGNSEAMQLLENPSSKVEHSPTRTEQTSENVETTR